MLLLNQDALVNPVLEVAAANVTVNVTADAPLLNRTSAVGVRFDKQRLTDLPTLPPPGGGGFRDVFAFALAAPGVSQLNSGNQVFAAGTNFSTNGSRPRSNNFMIDGQDSNDARFYWATQVMNNPEIVQEFRLITNQFSAEYGRAAGSVVNLVTKSGTNDFHGSGFWFHNDNALNSCSNLDKRAGLTDARFCSSFPGGRRRGALPDREPDRRHTGWTNPQESYLFLRVGPALDGPADGFGHVHKRRTHRNRKGVASIHRRNWSAGSSSLAVRARGATQGMLSGGTKGLMYPKPNHQPATSLS